jgi:hypothetical protein
MGFGFGFLRKAATTGLRIGLNHVSGGASEKVIKHLSDKDKEDVGVDSGILAVVGDRGAIVSAITEKITGGKYSTSLKLAEIAYDAKILMELNRTSMVDGHRDHEEKEALLEGCLELLKDMNDLLDGEE